MQQAEPVAQRPAPELRRARAAARTTPMAAHRSGLGSIQVKGLAAAKVDHVGHGKCVVCNAQRQQITRIWKTILTSAPENWSLNWKNAVSRPSRRR
jgi:hypothetical protein